MLVVGGCSDFVFAQRAYMDFSFFRRLPVHVSFRRTIAKLGLNAILGVWFVVILVAGFGPTSAVKTN